MLTTGRRSCGELARPFRWPVGGEAVGEGAWEGVAETEGHSIISYTFRTALVCFHSEDNKGVKRTLPPSYARKREGEIELKICQPFLRKLLVYPFRSLYRSCTTRGRAHCCPTGPREEGPPSGWGQ